MLKFNILQAAGLFQLCPGQDGGCEVAIHAVHELFNHPDTKVILLIDTSKAFNSLTRNMALLNIQKLCPFFYTIKTHNSELQGLGGSSKWCPNRLETHT